MALVLVAVVLGAVIVGRAQRTGRELVATRDLAAGTTLRAEDLRLADARVPDGSGYVEDSDRAVGKVLTRPLSAGELVPAAALGEQPSRTTVTVPFAADAAPQLRRGQRIVVWLSAENCPEVVLLNDVVVQDVQTSGGAFGTTGSGQDAVLTVAPDEASRVVSALALDKASIRAGVLTGAPDTSDAPLPTLSGCGPSSSP